MVSKEAPGINGLQGEGQTVHLQTKVSSSTQPRTERKTVVTESNQRSLFIHIPRFKSYLPNVMSTYAAPVTALYTPTSPRYRARAVGFETAVIAVIFALKLKLACRMSKEAGVYASGGSVAVSGSTPCRIAASDGLLGLPTVKV